MVSVSPLVTSTSWVMPATHDPLIFSTERPSSPELRRRSCAPSTASRGTRPVRQSVGAAGAQLETRIEQLVDAGVAAPLGGRGVEIDRAVVRGLVKRDQHDLRERYVGGNRRRVADQHPLIVRRVGIEVQGFLRRRSGTAAVGKNSSLIAAADVPVSGMAEGIQTQQCTKSWSPATRSAIFW